MSLMFLNIEEYIQKIKQTKFWLCIKIIFWNKIYKLNNSISFQKITFNYHSNFFKELARECHEVISSYITVLWLVIFWKKNETFSLILSRKGSVRFKRSPEKCFHCFSCDMERGFRELDFCWCGPSWQFLETVNFSNESPEISKTIRNSLGQAMPYYDQYFFILCHNKLI